VEDFTVESGKTKDFAAIINGFASKERTVVILPDNNTMLKRAGRNIPHVNFLSYNRLSAHGLFYARNVLMLESAAKSLNTFWNKADKGEAK
jgi:large subunit ribosomal protein L4